MVSQGSRTSLRQSALFLIWLARVLYLSVFGIKHDLIFKQVEGQVSALDENMPFQDFNNVQSLTEIGFSICAS